MIGDRMPMGMSIHGLWVVIGLHQGMRQVDHGFAGRGQEPNWNLFFESSLWAHHPTTVGDMITADRFRITHNKNQKLIEVVGRALKAESDSSGGITWVPETHEATIWERHYGR